MPTATVTTPPQDGSRALRIRPDRGVSDAPATLAAGLVITLGTGARVHYDVIGRRLVVRGGA